MNQDPQELFEMAKQDHQAGKLAEAEMLYQNVIARQPDHAEAMNLLGIILAQTSRPQKAAEMLRRAVAARPGAADIHNNLANVLVALNELPEAIAEYQAALALNPDFPRCHSNLSHALRLTGRYEEAIATARRALELNPGYAPAYVNLGYALQERGDLPRAIDAYRNALMVRPDLAEAQSNLGSALSAAGKIDEGIAACRRAVDLSPNFAQAHVNLGTALQAAGRLEEALASFDRARTLSPDYPSAHSNWFFTAAYLSDFDPRAILREMKKSDARNPRPMARHSNTRQPERPLKIGYVSPDFRRHCQSFFTIPLLSHHDHGNFEIYCYADVPRPDEITRRIQGYADEWRSTVGKGDEQVAQEIREDGIDILVDLTMHMARGRPGVFARKPTPLQVAWLAYPGTTGLSAMDYRLSDPYLDPPGEHDGWYAEKTIQLPDTFWCYDPLGEVPAVQALPASQNGYVTFGCLNNFCKVTDQTLELWGRVMKEIPRSKLILLSPQGEHRRRVISQLGVEGSRVEFVEFTPRDKYLDLYRRIDLCLDTFPYNGHTTSLDSFWMGVPVVTLCGQTAVSRAGWSQAKNLGLEDRLVAQRPDQFVENAIKIATDLQALSDLRNGLRTKMEKSPLMDGKRFAANFEAALRDIWRRWTS
jgi:protein O-GlcNAc transferase